MYIEPPGEREPPHSRIYPHTRGRKEHIIYRIIDIIVFVSLTTKKLLGHTRLSLTFLLQRGFIG
jgi:hypothetical protein